MITILCAAIHFKDGETYKSGPINITSGIVILGRRHHDAFEILENLLHFDKNLIEHDDLGFITSDNRFVTRKEAWLIAKEANQIQGPNKEDELNILTSENLYYGDDK